MHLFLEMHSGSLFAVRNKWEIDAMVSCRTENVSAKVQNECVFMGFFTAEMRSGIKVYI